MVFSSITFLFLFLPITLLLHFLLGQRFRNGLLLLVSLVFYAWGEGVYVLLMLCSVLANYIFGLLISRTERTKQKKVFLALAVVVNLAPLMYFKYSEFFLDTLHGLLSSIHIEHSQHLHLPIGISFFTFQALSYVIDVYRKVTTPQKNLLNMGLYVAFFPQLIAGPIVRYHDIARQIVRRTITIDDFAIGIERFVFGLGKKVLLANPMGAIADTVFALEVSQLSTSTAWLGIVCYTLQIYFDFSGYSDMAIGLGRMFGFRFLENFNYPYISRSMQEFWRRWHISLSNWFKDYLYIPLGGNRVGRGRTYVNLVLVFFLCGFWHGASWNFILWGLLHGFFLALERGKFGSWLHSLHPVLRHLYVLVVLCNTWVFFRVETLQGSVQYLEAMYGLASGKGMYPFLAVQLDLQFFSILCAALVFSMPLYPNLQRFVHNLKERPSMAVLLACCSPLAKIGILGMLLLFSSMSLAVGSYNPFIYFRF